jgi:hypothetical protein
MSNGLEFQKQYKNSERSKYFFQEALIVNIFFVIIFFLSVVEQELYLFCGIGARALTQCGSGSNGSGYICSSSEICRTVIEECMEALVNPPVCTAISCFNISLYIDPLTIHIPFSSCGPEPHLNPF